LGVTTGPTVGLAGLGAGFFGAPATVGVEVTGPAADWDAGIAFFFTTEEPGFAGVEFDGVPDFAELVCDEFDGVADFTEFACNEFCGVPDFAALVDAGAALTLDFVELLPGVAAPALTFAAAAPGIVVAGAPVADADFGFASPPGFAEGCAVDGAVDFAIDDAVALGADCAPGFVVDCAIGVVAPGVGLTAPLSGAAEGLPVASAALCGLGGTVGKRWARMSTARIGVV